MQHLHAYDWNVKQSPQGPVSDHLVSSWGLWDIIHQLHFQFRLFEEMTKGTFLLYPCLVAELAKLVQGWSLGLIGVKAVAFSTGLWLPVLTQLCLRHPVFCLPTLSGISLCWLWWLFPWKWMILYLINMLGISHQFTQDTMVPAIAFVFSISHPCSSCSTPCHMGPLFLQVQATQVFCQSYSN